MIKVKTIQHYMIIISALHAHIQIILLMQHLKNVNMMAHLYAIACVKLVTILHQQLAMLFINI